MLTKFKTITLKMNIMKKSILIIATMALATFNASAKTEKENYILVLTYA